MFKKKWLVSGIGLGILLAGCSGGTDQSESDMSTEVAVTSDESGEVWDSETEESTTNTDVEGNLIGEKVIRSVYRDYETLDFEESNTYIMDRVAEFSGFVEQSNQSTGNYMDDSNRIYRDGYYTLRIPTESLEGFLEQLDGIDAIKLNENVGTEDVTQNYTDTESRVNVLRNKEERLNSLLEQAESIEDIIQIENSLSETIAERESLQTVLDNYDSLTDYTRVEISLSERPRISGERESRPFLERIQEALVDSAYAFYYVLQSLIIGLIYALPFLIGIGLIIWIGYYIHKKRTNKDK
ncbi:DUF4349 domain-containing protein [Marinilactibacillus sp. Marseille-P9653]|uniref:DUF4349 domain-containing protein n=1 Tax=Marinilactibacillus sp. Marseille-P9653 TaxID=2866583 RepID=UPI001CE48B48|nr:DUF4349 domain-containing protein [Marinilactibacillus sp. Marseille-P9653]